MELYYLCSKSAALISCAISAQLICVFVFTKAEIRFTQDAAHVSNIKAEVSKNDGKYQKSQELDGYIQNALVSMIKDQ